MNIRVRQKQSQASDERDPRLLKLLTDTQSAMVRLFDVRAQHLGLTRAQWRIVSGLYGHAGMTQTELSERTGIARSPLGKIIDQLESKGYLERRSDPEDRRINRLHLTDVVVPLLEPARDVATRLEMDVMDGVSSVAEITELLAKLNDRLHQLVTEEVYNRSDS